MRRVHRLAAFLGLACVAGAVVLARCPRGRDADAVTAFSRATYGPDGVLLFCFDADARGKLHGGSWTVKDREEAVSRAEAADAGAYGAGAKQVILDRVCADAFADRIELASCAARDGSLTVRYYSFAALDADRETSCRKVLKGTWNELRQDSDAFRTARARYDAERAQRAARAAPGSSW
ncbi:MAG TPA: hypothetical protein VGG39_00325 [Polyangiaceae bacterium]